MRPTAPALLATLLLAAGLAPAALAQERQQQNPPQTQTAPVPQSGSSSPSGSAGEQLNRSGGVIHPPATGDSSIVAPPNTGNSAMPVIRPPGAPGGNQGVQPK